MSTTSFFQSMMAEIGRIYSWVIGRETAIDSQISAKEIAALIRYAAENGIDTPGPDPQKPDQTTLTLLNDALNQYKILSSQPASDDHERRQGAANATSDILYHYTRLTQTTKVNGRQVNGRTLIDTQNSSRSLFLLFFTTAMLAALAVFNEILVSLVDDQVYLPGTQSVAYFLKEHVFQQLIPYVWGALGGCIYLSMRFYGIAMNRAFDRTQLHGWVLRVLLASIIGAITFYIVTPADPASSAAPMGTKALAFLAGLGVKVVYGAFEKLIDTLVQEFNLDSPRGAPGGKVKIREYLALRLSDPKVANDPKMRDAIASMIRELGVDTQKAGPV